MTWQVIVALLFTGVALVATVVKLLANEETAGRYAKLTMAVAATLAIGTLVVGSFTVVSTRNVGVVTTFGRPGATMGNGLHLKAPWQSVSEMDGAIQIDTFNGEDRISVRLGNNSTALADVSVRWQIKQEAASQLFLDYRTFENLRTNLVTRSLQAALNDVFSNFDPISPENADGTNLQEQADAVLKNLQGKIGTQITVIEVIVPIVDYDDQTEQRINQLNSEKAATRVAEQRQQTAEAEARANQKLAESVANDPNVLVSQCINKALDKGISPLGCWPGTSAVPTIPVK